jgi:transcriptional regulator GlxA family with amidase domain
MSMTNGHDLLALRRALWDVAERAQRAIAQLEVYLKAQPVDTSNPTSPEPSSSAAGGGDQAEQTLRPLSERELRQSTVAQAAMMTRAALRPGHSREVARALRHIELHFERPIDLRRLSRIAGCSTSTLTRAFRRDLGQTPREYLIGIRLARAACAMTSGDKVESVMLAVGFRSKRHFYRLFKAQFGQTPATFRGEEEPSPPP